MLQRERGININIINKVKALHIQGIYTQDKATPKAVIVLHRTDRFREHVQN